MSPSDKTVESLLHANGQWAQAVIEADQTFFERSAEGQSPKVLWIGCSDSRVPESVITGSKPGDIFVHRNIANQVHLHDDSVLSVVAFAVDALKVKHVVVVGHSNCGGVIASIEAAGSPPQPASSPLTRWLTPLVDLARSLKVDSLGEQEAVSFLVKESVKKQVKNLVGMETITNAWRQGNDVQVHGLVYDLSTGRLSDLNVTEGLQSHGK